MDRGRRRSLRLADESGDLHLRVAIRAASAYARCTPATSTGSRNGSNEVIELAGGDPRVGAGIVIGNPLAWAHMGKATVRRERGEFAEAERLLEQAMRLADETRDPESASWIRGTQATCCARSRATSRGRIALSRRNCELTEQLGDVFSRSLALTNLAYCLIAAGDHEEALKSIEEAERIYRDAMGIGGEMEAWRGGIWTEALRGVGRIEDAVEVARRATGEGRRLGRRWSLPLTLLAQARAEAANGEVEEARSSLDEAAGIASKIGSTLALEEIEAERGALSASAR